jgi:S-adenosylmethionine:tRNA ribosyltransferase-isomerase
LLELAQFDYELPPSSIAQEPATPRDASRLMVLDRTARRWDDRRFADLPELLRPGDCLVLNTTRVIPARLLGESVPGGRPVELLLLRALSPVRWEALVRPGRRCRIGARVALAGGAAVATVMGERPGGAREVELKAPWPVAELLARHGLPPLPPYIERHRAPKPDDAERYQTVYAREGVSVAAPTAGLHFTPELLARLAARGVETRELRLDVGPGTFRPIQASGPEAHAMEAEPAWIPADTADAIARAKAEHRRVIAVGTTTTRALESAAVDGGVRAGPGEAGLFIRPPYRFRVVDALLTNFHLPRTTLLLLVCAFAGRELVLDAYAHAVTAGYRFYSFGDAMLLT